MSNTDLRKVFAEASKNEYRYEEILDKMNKREVFYVWIRLSEKDAVQALEPKILKLYYEANSHPSPVPFLKSLRTHIFNTQFLFTIPSFDDEYIKEEGMEYDTFYVVTLPENNVTRYEIGEKTKRVKHDEPSGAFRKESYQAADIVEGLHENKYRHSISIRLPPLEEQIKFRIAYYVAPDASERHFFAIAVFSLLIISILVALIGLKFFDYEMNPSLAFLRPVVDNLNTLLGGIITISLVVIGLIRNPFMDRTRFWFLLPIAVSSIAFLLQGFLPSGKTG